MPSTTAKERYELRQTEIADLMANLTEALQEHHARASREPKNWNYVGDLANVADGLAQALAFLNGE